MFLFLSFAILAAVGLWWYSTECREAALAAAQQHCHTVGVQLLDGSVVSNGFRLTRRSSGSLALVQKFYFEFSTTGDRRYRGYLEQLGKRTIRIELEAHKL